MKQSETFRGFDLITFKDRYGEECTIQESSLATEDAIWFGSSGRVQVMCSNHPELNKGNTGWTDYPLPVDALVHSRMHLTKEMVERLIPILQKFVDEGNIK